MTTHPDPKRLRLAAEVLGRYRFALWNYGDSVGLEGLLSAADALNEPLWEGWVYGALKAWAGRKQRTFTETDNTAPGHTLCLVYERTRDDALVDAAMELVAFLTSRSRVDSVFTSWSQTPLRPPHSGRPLKGHEAALLHHPGPGVFVDCLHFDPPFFAHFGRLIERNTLVDIAVEQALGYIRLLRDDNSSLFWHFFLERTEQRYGYGWGRGQGWALLGLLDLLNFVPDTHPARHELLDAARSLAHALAGLQREDGGWYAVVSDPGSGDESSTAAFAAAGFARGVSKGFFGDEFLEPARRAWEHTLSRVDRRGVLLDVSAAVWPCTDQSHYSHLPKGFIVPWGQGALLVAAHAMRLTPT